MKKLISVVLVLMLLISAIPVFADSDDSVTVYLTISKYTEFVTSADGEIITCVPVILTEDTGYTLDDLFRVAHALYYEDGEDGYASSVSEQYGHGVDKLWGDTSYNFGYQVNGGAEYVSGADHILDDGDYVDAYIYKNSYPFSEGYAFFDKYTAEIYAEDELSLTLTFADGYDEEWNTIYSLCDGAAITIDGEPTDSVTDENGEVTLCFEEVGTYTVSAAKTKMIDDGESEYEGPAITAPVCIVTVNERPEVQIVHNIASYYADADMTSMGGNLPWIVADMITYAELFPDSDNILSDEQKKIALADIVALADESDRPGDLAKCIIALRAMGYDARDVYTADFEEIDVVDKLIAIVDNEDESVTDVYTIPYVIIALSQEDDYATDEQMDYLVSSALSSREVWISTEFGTDGMTPMIVALAPFCEDNEDVSVVLNGALDVLRDEQREDGLIDGFPDYEAASTGLALCSFSAMGIDSYTIAKGEYNLIDGLMSTADDNFEHFPNAFATEQGFRGLLALNLFKAGTGKIIYDFSGMPLEEANVTGAQYCPVVFDVNTDKASVEIEGVEELYDNCFDLTAGTYEYKVTASGYKPVTGEITITEEDAVARQPKTVEVTLKRNGGGGGGSYVPDDEEDEKTDENKEDVSVTPEDTTKPAVTFTDVKSDAWYYDAVNYVTNKNIFKGTDKGFEPDSTMTRAMLVTVIHRLDGEGETAENVSFADVSADMWYTKSVNWASSNNIVNGITEESFNPDGNITREQLAVILYRYASYKGYNTECDNDITSYSDYKDISSYATDAIRYAVSIGVMNGRTSDTLAPLDSVTRAEVATMLMRFAEMH